MNVAGIPELARPVRSYSDDELLNALRRNRSLYRPDDDDADDDDSAVDALLQFDDLEEPEPGVQVVARDAGPLAAGGGFLARAAQHLDLKNE